MGETAEIIYWGGISFYMAGYSLEKTVNIQGAMEYA